MNGLSLRCARATLLKSRLKVSAMLATLESPSKGTPACDGTRYGPHKMRVGAFPSPDLGVDPLGKRLAARGP